MSIFHNCQLLVFSFCQYSMCLLYVWLSSILTTCAFFILPIYVLWMIGQHVSLTLDAHAQRGLRSCRVCLCVCLSVKSHLTSGAFVRPDNSATYSAANEGQKICGVFSETALFQSYGTSCIVRLPCSLPFSQCRIRACASKMPR